MPSRFGQDGRTPLPCPAGHWGHAARSLPWYKADGLDAVAADKGLEDGLAVLEKATGHDAGDLAAASRAQIDRWWAECYQWAGVHPGWAGGEVVTSGLAMYAPGSGWDTGHRLTINEGAR